jgi:DNA-binding transcriptional regulator YhcF (GntR family)
MPVPDVARIRLDKRSKVPVQHQLKRHIEFLVLSGQLRDGDRLPSHRDLAEAIGVNRNTVAQVYAELEAEGWVRGRPGSGTFVQAASHVSDRNLAALGTVVDEALARAAELGFAPEALLRCLQGRLRLRPDRAAGPGSRHRVAGRSYL